MANWWEAPITQAHGVNGEQGVDLGTSYGTPITDILGGVVKAVNCAVGWRCEVDVATTYQGQQVTESFLHIDQPAVAAGQRLSPGDLVGLSGGQTSGGINNDDPNFSTGPHVEYDIFGGAAWQNPIDPTAVARGGPSGVSQLPIIGGLVSGVQGAAGAAQAAAQGPSAVAGAIAGLPASVGHGLAGALSASIHNVGVWAHNQVIPLMVALVVALVIFVR
jgi:murein DD-endopeptidase MepM/ murein hydrolase activator NlpD